jgi:Ca-activated chloride channel family protein
MLHRVTAILAAGLLSNILQPGSWAAVGTPSPLDGASTLTIRKQVKEVNVSFTVEDRHKRLLGGVTRDQVGVVDAGDSVTNFTSFRKNSDLPLRLALLVDCSDSMRKGFSKQRVAAQTFVERLLRPKIDSLLLMEFAGQSMTSEIPGVSPSLINSRINSFTAAGHTALYDAIFEASRRLQLNTPAQQPIRRIMILLSDGEDNESRHARAEAIEMSQRGDVVIYAITAHSRRYEFQGDAILRRIAQATGGRAFILSSFDQVDKVLAEIEKELRTQYSMTFLPPRPAQCGFHPLQIQYRIRKMKVRAKEGYFLCGPIDVPSSGQ